MDQSSLTPEHYGRDSLTHDVAAAVERAFPGAPLLTARDLATEAAAGRIGILAMIAERG